MAGVFGFFLVAQNEKVGTLKDIQGVELFFHSMSWLYEQLKITFFWLLGISTSGKDTHNNLKRINEIQ